MTCSAACHWNCATPAGYLDDVGLGDSIALNGACMTAATIDLPNNQFSIDISAESLDKTSGLADTGVINLEKALRAHDRLGGHMVSGHVDGIGKVTHFAEVGESWELRVTAPPKLSKYLNFLNYPTGEHRGRGCAEYFKYTTDYC